MNDLKFQLPFGYYLLFLVLAALLSYLLYSKEIKRKFCTKTLLSLLISLRFIFLSFLFLLLFEPIIFQLIEKKEKPILVFAQDNSESILNNKDSLFIQTAFKDSIKDLLNELNNKFEIIPYSFGQEAKENNIYNFNESITNSRVNQWKKIFSFKIAPTKTKTPLNQLHLHLFLVPSCL